MTVLRGRGPRLDRSLGLRFLVAVLLSVLVLGALSVAFAGAGWLIALYDVYPALALSELVVQVLELGAAFWWLLPFLTLLLGFLTGGLGALTGHFGARLFLWAEPVPVASPKA